MPLVVEVDFDAKFLVAHGRNSMASCMMRTKLVERRKVGVGVAGAALAAVVLYWSTTGATEVRTRALGASSACGHVGDQAPGWTPGGRIVFTRCLATGSVRRLAVGTDGDRAEPLAPGTEVTRLSRSADGLLIAFTRRGALFVTTPDGRFTRRVLQRRLAAAQPVWSRDGRWLAFVHPGEDGGPAVVYVVRRDGLGLRQLTDGGPR